MSKSYYSSAAPKAALAAGIALLASCATTSPRPQQFRTFFLPQAVAAAAVGPTIADPPPDIQTALYANEVPTLRVARPVLPRPSDTEFLLKSANDRYTAGKKALQEGRTEEARRNFDRAIQILLTAPEDSPERARVEQRLQELVDAISRYDSEELGGGEPAEQATREASPIDEILDLTFPVDPSLRNKVRAQIQSTVSQLPLEETDAVISYINFFSSPRGKKILAAGIKRSGRYKSMIAAALAEEGLPRELIFLAQAESGFIPHAVSNKLCVGIWQFLRSRGEEYGLEVTSFTDARMDPERATKAAARHLHDLYMHLGDWYLAMAAYNCGPQCIDHAVARTGYADFWSLRRLNALPQETANYVPAILAMIIVSKNAKDYGLEDIELDQPLEYDTVELQSPVQLGLAATAVDRSVSELRDLNPALLTQVAPAGYRLHVPKGSVEQLEAAFSVIPANRRDSWRIHRVEEGDTVAALAKRYSTSAELIRSANHNELPQAGQFAAIPASNASKSAGKTVAHNSASKKAPTRKPATLARRASPKSAAHHVPGA